jgi:hypothetical protein
VSTIASQQKASPAMQLSIDEACTLAREAYIYLYPFVLMDVTRGQMTNVPPGEVFGCGPANEFVHARTFPPATFRHVVRPNFDTLYSIAWLDLTRGPMVVSVPDTAGRYYLLEMLDLWTDVFASPGKRTTGTKAQSFVVLPPGWSGTLPDTVERIEAPTPYVWVIGRTQTNGAADYEAVHKVQDGMSITSLEDWGRQSSPAAFQPDPSVDMKTPPVLQLENMPGGAFFSRAAEILKTNPPHIVDQPILARIRRIGIIPGVSFDISKYSPEVAKAIEDGATDGLAAVKGKVPTLGVVTNGWQMIVGSIGTYGAYYIQRASIALIGIGSNVPEDAVYPVNLSDSDGKPLDGANCYTLHFNKDGLPPVDAFWSVTVYDPQGFPCPNAINRCAIGDRDALQYNADGSLDLYIQHESPGAQRESNWLPAPTGPFNLTMRLYAPDSSVTYELWAPPPVKRT